MFDAHTVIIVGADEPLRLGPLNIPALPVLGQRREQVFDLTMPLGAHESTWNPRVELSFTDSRGRRWLRDVEGRLTDISSQRAAWGEGTYDERQMGRMDFDNPKAVALGFLSALREEPPNTTNLTLVLAPEADWTTADWADL